MSGNDLQFASENLQFAVEYKWNWKILSNMYASFVKNSFGCKFAVDFC